MNLSMLHCLPSSVGTAFVALVTNFTSFFVMLIESLLYSICELLAERTGLAEQAKKVPVSSDYAALNLTHKKFA
jgi:hypothetical protein